MMAVALFFAYWAGAYLIVDWWMSRVTIDEPLTRMTRVGMVLGSAVVALILLTSPLDSIFPENSGGIRSIPPAPPRSETAVLGVWPNSS